MDQLDADSLAPAAEKREGEVDSGKESAHTDSDELEQQATATAASSSTERSNLVRMLNQHNLISGDGDPRTQLIWVQGEFCEDQQNTLLLD